MENGQVFKLFQEIRETEVWSVEVVTIEVHSGDCQLVYVRTYVTNKALVIGLVAKISTPP